MKRTIQFIAAVLMTLSLTLHFSACTEQSPLKPTLAEDSAPALTLAKKGGGDKNQGGGGGKKSSFPQSNSKKIRFSPDDNYYRAGNFPLPNGSQFHLEENALTPPPSVPWGEDVTITMAVDKDTERNELLFTFGPSGCQFDPPVRIRMKWKNLGIQQPKLYYIEKDGSYTEQQPDYIDLDGKWLFIYVDHFSRYAIGAE